MLRGLVVWVMLLGVSAACTAQAVEAPVAPQTVAAPQVPAGSDAPSSSADQQTSGQAPQPVAPVAPVLPKTHHVRKFIVGSLIVGPWCCRRWEEGFGIDFCGAVTGKRSLQCASQTRDASVEMTEL